MRKILIFLLAFAVFLSACASKPTQTEPAEEMATWQEQYDLGMRYLSEGNYEEAIIALMAAIEIEPKEASAYYQLAALYAINGDDSAALRILREGYTATGDESLNISLDELKGTISDVDETRDGYTVSGTILDASEAFADEYQSLSQQYESAGFLAGQTIILFDNPVTIDDEGNRVTLDGAILAYSDVEGYIGRHVTITGQFYMQGEEFQSRVTGPNDYYDGMAIYYFNPVGPYLLNPLEISAG